MPFFQADELKSLMKKKKAPIQKVAIELKLIIETICFSMYEHNGSPSFHEVNLNFY